MPGLRALKSLGGTIGQPANLWYRAFYCGVRDAVLRHSDDSPDDLPDFLLLDFRSACEYLECFPDSRVKQNSYLLLSAANNFLVHPGSLWPDQTGQRFGLLHRRM